MDALLAVKNRNLTHHYFNHPSIKSKTMKQKSFDLISVFQDARVSRANDQADAGQLALQQGWLLGQLPCRCPWWCHDRPQVRVPIDILILFDSERADTGA